MSLRVKVLSLLMITLPALACSSSSSDGVGSSGSTGSTGSSGSSGSSGSDGSSGSGGPVSDIPEITSLAYYQGSQGPRVLVRGTDPLAVASSLHMEFLDADGQPAVVDPDGDGTSDPSELDIEVPAGQRKGAFFVTVQSVPRFDDTVKTIAVTPRDRSGNAGARKVTTIGAVPVRGSGEGCDAQGFDVCGSDLLCTPGAVDAPNTCASASQVRGGRCSDAPVLTVGATASVQGTATSGSAWEYPDGCASNERRGGPDTVVRVHVGSRVSSLTLSTNSTATNFDTVLYVLSSCDDSGAGALVCNDDDPPPTSSLTLRDVAAGDYMVVVDSLDPNGGAFELRATVP